MKSQPTALVVLAWTLTASAAPTLVEPGWILRKTWVSAGAQSPVYAADGSILVAKRNTRGADGIYRLDRHGPETLIVRADRPAGLVVTPNGDLFWSEDFVGRVFRLPVGGSVESLWVDGWHAGDDDPCGIAVVPAGWSGASTVSPGQVIVADQGFTGLDEIWKFNPAVAQGEVQLYTGTPLVAILDVAVSQDRMYFVDAMDVAAGTIWAWTGTGPLTALVTSSALVTPVGVTLDPVGGDLVVTDSGLDQVLRIDPETGTTSVMLSGFASPVDPVSARRLQHGGPVSSECRP